MRLKELLVAATPGVWAAEEEDEVDEAEGEAAAVEEVLELLSGVEEGGGWRIVSGHRVVARGLKEEDAVFIAHAYNTLVAARGEAGSGSGAGSGSSGKGAA